jgi:hypothetical protein
MKKHLIKFCTLVVVIGAIFWLGGLNIRAFVANELFEKGTLSWKDNLSAGFYSAYFRIIAISSILTVSSYLMVLIFSIIYLVAAKPDLKANGWLMASLILFFIFVPVEIYTSFYDLKFVIEYFFYSADYYYLKELLTRRITAFSGFPVIGIFCYYTIIALFIWKPMTKKNPLKNQ